MRPQAEEITLIGEILGDRQKGIDNGQASPNHLVDRLVRKFGEGGKPKLRRALYERLAREWDLNGDPVYTIISECVLASESATYSDRYFCAAVTRRLREAGFFKGTQGTQW